MNNCTECPYREKYTFICRHPEIIGICLTRRNSIPDWCPFLQAPNESQDTIYSGGEFWFMRAG